jgi:hypothetical protein
MKVDKKLLDKWKDLALFGDGEAISESMPEDTRVTGQTIRTLIRTGEYRSIDVLEAVIEFYKKREAKVKAIMNDALYEAEMDAADKPREVASPEPMAEKPKGQSGTSSFLKNQKSKNQFLESRRKLKSGQK